RQRRLAGAAWHRQGEQATVKATLLEPVDHAQVIPRPAEVERRLVVRLQVEPEVPLARLAPLQVALLRVVGGDVASRLALDGGGPAVALQLGFVVLPRHGSPLV